MQFALLAGFSLLAALSLRTGQAKEESPTPSVVMDGTAQGWRLLGEKDFVNVNGLPETWNWKDGVLHCSGQPVGVLRTQNALTNFELSVQWRHLRSGGNSGVFVWATEESIKNLKPNALPHGIEVQVLDNGYTEQYEKQSGKKATWFTTHGDVFAVGNSKLKPFAPTSPDGSRSFPRQQRSKGFGNWNSYYVRCINGEVRLWVNGEEVSGGSNAEPRRGYLCLESEGSPIEFKNIHIRELP